MNGVFPAEEDDERRTCRHCHSRSLRMDWAEGDRVCTNCGVVDEERIRDDRPEWREFNEAEDLVKGLAPAARCSLIPVDDRKYLGGLPPTSLSKHTFGPSSIGADRAAEERIRKRLLGANKKLDHLMNMNHSKALERARLSRLIRRRNAASYDDDHAASESLMPEHDAIVLQEEQEAEEVHALLQREKWSLDRAILLHGSEDEQPSSRLNAGFERDELLSRLDGRLRRAASDLYKAYKLLQESIKQLDLPDRVMMDASNTLCSYASKKDGFLVRGVASRFSVADNKNRRNEDSVEKLREYNKVKQMAALGSALLFLTARKHACTRSLAEVCSSFKYSSTQKQPFVKPKHCSKAMSELRSLFPDFMRSLTENTSVNTDNFVDHATRKLDLPPVASSCIRTLVKHCQDPDDELGKGGAKLSTTCASVAYFVCLAGEIMQRLARQSVSYAPSAPVKKRVATNDVSSQPRKKMKSNRLNNGVNGTDTHTAIPFDVFSHSPVHENQSEKSKYEMRRIWDAWSEQVPWTRSVGHIEQSCGVARKMIFDFYKSKLFPQRHQLLDVLCESVKVENGENRLRETPLAQALLTNITTAASLMT